MEKVVPRSVQLTTVFNHGIFTLPSFGKSPVPSSKKGFRLPSGPQWLQIAITNPLAAFLKRAGCFTFLTLPLGFSNGIQFCGKCPNLSKMAGFHGIQWWRIFIGIQDNPQWLSHIDGTNHQSLSQGLKAFGRKPWRWGISVVLEVCETGRDLESTDLDKWLYQLGSSCRIKSHEVLVHKEVQAKHAKSQRSVLVGFEAPTSSCRECFFGRKWPRQQQMAISTDGKIIWIMNWINDWLVQKGTRPNWPCFTLTSRLLRGCRLQWGVSSFWNTPGWFLGREIITKSAAIPGKIRVTCPQSSQWGPQSYVCFGWNMLYPGIVLDVVSVTTLLGNPWVCSLVHRSWIFWGYILANQLRAWFLGI